MPFFFSIFWAGKDERITCEGKAYQSDQLVRSAGSLVVLDQ